MLTRRQLIQRGALGGAALAAPGTLLRAAAAGAQSRQLRMFKVPLPVPGSAWQVAQADGADIVAKQFTISVHPDLPPTTVWGYQLRSGKDLAGNPLSHPSAPATYLGPTLVASPNVPASVKFENGLTTPLFPADPMLVPDGVNPATVRLNTHLHGGRIDDASDGNPFDAYSGGKAELTPNASYTQVYANDQGDALLWYHDHALGITRTNVYAGLAGGYILTDGKDNKRNLPFATNASGVPDPYGTGMIPLDIPLIIQDRDFSAAGNLRYPDPWAPEFFGRVPLVNGKAYPFLQVEPRKYRFRFLNGSQSRFYNLVLSPVKKLASVTQVGVELGFLDSPFDIKNGPGSILLAPAERADVIVDFSGFRTGQTVTLTDAPLPIGVVSPTMPLGDIMQFQVVGTKPATDFGDPVLPGWSESGGTGRPGAATATSLVTLDEILGGNGKPLMAVINNMPFMKRGANGMMLATPDAPFSTEDIRNGESHAWKFLNLTADTHPIHLHLAHFEVVERQAFDAVGYQAALVAAGRITYDPAAPTDAMRMDPKDYPDITPYLLGTPTAARGDEKGPKDTVRANPMELTTIRAKFDVPAGTLATDTEARYVYHCHILEHEENEMMRPLRIRA